MVLPSSRSPSSSIAILDDLANVSFDDYICSNLPDKTSVRQWIYSLGRAIRKSHLMQALKLVPPPLPIYRESSVSRILLVMLRGGLHYDRLVISSKCVVGVGHVCHVYQLASGGVMVCSKTHTCPPGFELRMYEDLLLPLYFALKYKDFVNYVRDHCIVNVGTNVLLSKRFKRIRDDYIQHLKTELVEDVSSEIFSPQSGEIQPKQVSMSFLEYLIVIYVYFTSIYFMSRVLSRIYVYLCKLIQDIPTGALFRLKTLLFPVMENLVVPEPFCVIPGFEDVPCGCTYNATTDEFLFHSSAFQYIVSRLGFTPVAREARINGTHVDLIFRTYDGCYLVVECKKGKKRAVHNQSKKHAAVLSVTLGKPVYYASYTHYGFVPYGIVHPERSVKYLQKLDNDLLNGIVTDEPESEDDDPFEPQVGSIDLRTQNVYLTQFPSEGSWNEVRRNDKPKKLSSKPTNNVQFAAQFDLLECYYDQQRYFTPQDFVTKRKFDKSDARKIVNSKLKHRREVKKRHERFSPQMGGATPPVSSSAAEQFLFGTPCGTDSSKYRSTYFRFGGFHNSKSPDNKQLPVIKEEEEHSNGKAFSFTVRGETR